MVFRRIEKILEVLIAFEAFIEVVFSIGAIPLCQ
jgi:hypothetical protein